MPGFFKLLLLKTKEINVKDVFPEGHKIQGEGPWIVEPVSKSPPMHLLLYGIFCLSPNLQEMQEWGASVWKII